MQQAQQHMSMAAGYVPPSLSMPPHPGVLSGPAGLLGSVGGSVGGLLGLHAAGLGGSSHGLCSNSAKEEKGLSRICLFSCLSGLMDSSELLTMSLSSSASF